MNKNKEKIESISIKEKLGIKNLATNFDNDIEEELKTLTAKELYYLKKELKKLNYKEKINKLKIIIDSQKRINELKKDIETNNITPELLIRYIELVKNIEPIGNRPMFLSGIFAGFNKMGIIYELNGDKIKLSPGKRKNLNQKFSETLTQLETTFNSSGIKKEIILKSFLYSSSRLDTYINSKPDGKYNIDEYVLFLLESYPSIKTKISYQNNSGNNDGNEKRIIINVKNEDEYKSLKENIKKDLLNNPQDVAFVLTYLDNIYYNEGKNKDVYDIKEYKETTNKTEKNFLKAVSTLSEEEQAILGVTNPNRLKELKNMATHNPIELLQEGLKNGGPVLGIILGIIGAIFKGWKGFLGGFLLGFIGNIVGIDGIKDLINEGGEKISKLGKGKTPGETTDVQDTTNSIFDKYEGLFSGSSETEKLKIWKDLSENKKFLNAEASILNIFESQKSEIEIKEELKKIGIEITNDNEIYYKDIFSKILKERKNDIGDIKEDENVKEYLERTSRSDDVKNKLISYFNIDQKEIANIEADFKRLNLDINTIYNLLKSYKNFIENNLTGLDENILNKIKLSINKRLLFIISKIDNLKKDDYYKTDFENNRWIINSEIEDLFGEINNKILPSAYLLLKYDESDKKEKNNYTKKQKEKINRIRQMFDSELNKAGKFDKTFWSKAGFGEVWDTSTNNWEVFDITDENDLAFLEQNGFKNDELEEEISLLNEEDKKIEEDAMIAYITLTAIQVLPLVGTLASLPSMFGDVFLDQEGTIAELKMLGIVPENFRMEKNKWDGILGMAGLIASVFRAQGIVKGGKLAQKFPKVRKIPFHRVKNMLQKIAPKLGLSKNQTNFVLTNLKKMFDNFNKNSFIKESLNNLKVGESIDIGNLKIEKLQNGKYRITEGKTIFDELKPNQVISKIKKLDPKKIDSFILDKKIKYILENKVGQQAKVNGYIFKIEKQGNKTIIKVLDPKNNNKVLSQKEAKKIINNNFEEFIRKFYGTTTSKAIEKAKEKTIRLFESIGIKTIGDYIEKAGFYYGKRSKFNFQNIKETADFFGGILLTPFTTIKQLISAGSNKEWENIIKIMIFGNKNLRAFGEPGEKLLSRAFSSGIRRTSGIIGLVNIDDLFDEDTSIGDEIGDFAFYMYAGIFDTILVKALVE